MVDQKEKKIGDFDERRDGKISESLSLICWLTVEISSSPLTVNRISHLLAFDG